MTHDPLPLSQAYEELENVGRSPAAHGTLGDVVAARLGRRDLMRGALAVAVATLAPDALPAQEPGTIDRFPFTELAAGVDDTHHVAAGHDAAVLIRWGDPVLPGAPAFNPTGQTAASQRLQFGYNNDFLAFLPIPGVDPARRGLLVVNHEYTNVELMFPGYDASAKRNAILSTMSSDLMAIEMAAHGGSVIEIVREDGAWRVVPDSRYARRIDLDTPMEITGPAAGHPRLTTRDDPTGRRVLGMINNCAGGVTPWGTWLTCEENFNGYFWGKIADDHPEARSHKRYGVSAITFYGWGRFHDRFDVTKEPNEANRFGWIVEIDPLDPTSTPKKRTALGRMKHEGAAGAVAPDGRYVIYTGDDEQFDYVYRFVTAKPVVKDDPAANRDLLDEGVLSVARYDADGNGEWLDLIHGQGPLTPANGFENQADVLIETRRAADLLGATRMDRPEDVEVDPVTQRVYVALTGNTRRTEVDLDKANPRPNNRFGHVLEMIPPDGDHAARRFRWEMLLRAGDPAAPAVGAAFGPGTTRDGWFGMPDNLAFDRDGRMWIATDGNSSAATGRADGLWAVETAGPSRGLSKHFFRVPRGAELCGPAFTPDGETLFLAIQHPGERDDGKGPMATFENPSTRWPDFSPDMPPRPAIVAVTRKGGGRVG